MADTTARNQSTTSNDATDTTLLLANTGPASDLTQELAAALNSPLGSNGGDGTSSARVDPTTEASAELQAALSLAAEPPAPSAIPVVTRKRRRKSTELVPDTVTPDTLPSTRTPLRTTGSANRLQTQEAVQVDPGLVGHQSGAEAPPAPPAILIPANAPRKRRRQSTEFIPTTVPSAPHTVPSTRAPVRTTRSVSRRQTQEALQAAQADSGPFVSEPQTMEGIDAPPIDAPPAPPAIPANAPTVPSALPTVPSTGTPVRMTRSVSRRQTQEALQAAQAGPGPVVSEPETMEGIDAPPAPPAIPANAPTVPSALPTVPSTGTPVRMTRSAGPGPVVSEPETMEGIDAPPAPPAIPANAPTVPSASPTVPSTGTPVRMTRSVSRRQTQEVLQAAQAGPGPVVNQPVAEPESMEGIEASETLRWRAKEAEFITRQVNAQKALQELAAQLAEAQKRATAAELQAALALADAPLTPPAIPANAPRKRRRRSAEVVPDTVPLTGTAARTTRSMLHRQTQEALPEAQLNPGSGSVVNQPTATPATASTEGDVAHQTRQNLQTPIVQLPPRGARTNAAGADSRGTLTTPKSKARNVVKPVAQVYRFLPQDMPDDLGGVKKAMDIHVRILWGLLDAKAVPKDPSVRILNQFSDRFSTETQLQATLSSGPELIPLNLVQIGTLMSSSRSGIAKHARLVEENMLSYIQVRLSRFGFDKWCPDLRQTPYALYNCACRIVALDTFKQALVANTYEHLGPNLHYAQNVDLLVRLFDHFTFHYMYERYQKESRAPGRVEEDLKRTPTYQNRKRLALARLDFLEKNHYPPRYRDLVDSKATSDDEFDHNTRVWHIKRRPERSAKAERFLRILDQKREEYCRQNGKRWQERTRVVPTSQEDSVFKVLPEKMPVDYFDPEFFNKLQPGVRNRVAVAQVAFLPDVNQSMTWCDDEILKDREFNRKYGHRVFRQYNMVTDADLAAANDSDSGVGLEAELGDDEGDGDWIDDNEPRSAEESSEGHSGSDMSISASESDETSSASATYIPSTGPTPGPEDGNNNFGEATVGPSIPGPSGA